jgi:hypothetical protein
MKTVMKKVVFALLLGLTSQAQAQVIDTTGVDFSFAGLDWTSSFQYFPQGQDPAPSIPGDGVIRTDADATVFCATCNLTIDGSNNGSGVYQETAMYSTAVTDGTLDFDWAFTNNDIADWEFFFWINTGTGDGSRELTALASAGSESFVVGAGSLFGISIDTRDNTLGNSFVDISGFEWTAAGGNTGAVPVPAALWLFGTALAGLGFMRKKKDLKAAI